MATLRRPRAKLELSGVQRRGPSAMQVATIGLDLAKSVFQIHGVDGVPRTVLKHRLRRSELLEFFAKLTPCLVGLEACGRAHWWAREIAAVGYVVRLMPARYVRPVSVWSPRPC